MFEYKSGGQVVHGLALSALFIYMITGPFRGNFFFGIVPNTAIIIASVTSCAYIIICKEFSTSKYTLLTGSLLVLLVLAHILMNNFYELTAWSMLDIVYNFFILIPLFWLPNLLVDSDRSANLEVNTLFHGHLFATLITSALVFLIGIGVISNPLDQMLGDRLGLAIERTTYPIRSISVFFVYITPATIFAFGKMLEGKYKSIYFMFFSLLMVTSIMTAFRKVWIGVASGLISYLLLKKETRRITYTSLILFSPVLIFILYLIFRLASDSAIIRINSLISTAEVITTNPLGVGHNGVRSLTGSSAHNIFLSVFSRYGIVAFVPFLMVCTISILQVIRVGMRSSKTVTMALAATVIALLVGMQFENSYIMHRFWLLIGLFFAATDVDMSGESGG
jgi:hypothetical protein